MNYFCSLIVLWTINFSTSAQPLIHNQIFKNIPSVSKKFLREIAKGSSRLILSVGIAKYVAGLIDNNSDLLLDYVDHPEYQLAVPVVLAIFIGLSSPSTLLAEKALAGSNLKLWNSPQKKLLTAGAAGMTVGFLGVSIMSNILLGEFHKYFDNHLTQLTLGVHLAGLGIGFAGSVSTSSLLLKGLRSLGFIGGGMTGGLTTIAQIAGETVFFLTMDYVDRFAYMYPFYWLAEYEVNEYINTKGEISNIVGSNKTEEKLYAFFENTRKFFVKTRKNLYHQIDSFVTSNLLEMGDTVLLNYRKIQKMSWIMKGAKTNDGDYIKNIANWRSVYVPYHLAYERISGARGTRYLKNTWAVPTQDNNLDHLRKEYLHQLLNNSKQQQYISKFTRNKYYAENMQEVYLDHRFWRGQYNEIAFYVSASYEFCSQSTLPIKYVNKLSRMILSFKEYLAKLMQNELSKESILPEFYILHIDNYLHAVQKKTGLSAKFCELAISYATRSFKEIQLHQNGRYFKEVYEGSLSKIKINLFTQGLYTP